MFSFLRSLMSWPGRGSYGRTREREAGNAAPGGRDGGLPLAQSCHSKGLAGIWLCTIWSCTAAAEGRQRGDMAFGARKGEQAGSTSTGHRPPLTAPCWSAAERSHKDFPSGG